MKSRKPNHLVHEKSPYLLQHAYNPVDWFPWGQEAFDRARNEHKPIFLSIGYSTCHWCHVMERESFEDTEVAKLLNNSFVCIKVDREERPDIDNLYMTVCQLMTGSGGWPLTIIMAPDKKPFFAATYVPKKNKFGKIGLIELIPQIKTLWEQRQDKVLHTVNQVAIALEHISHVVGSGRLDDTILKTTYEHLTRSFDGHYGGFGNFPKFPTPHNLMFLLRYWKKNSEQKALDMVEKTLHAMRHGGIFDHVGFGFHRYSTDRQWLLPHFEKMLYDQALIAMAYIETYQVTRKRKYKKTAEEIFDYVLRTMASPEGGFYSAEDADSEGEEGKFYIWSFHEIKKLLGRDANFIIKVFNIQKGGNFAEETSDKKTDSNILHLTKTSTLIARELGVSKPSLVRRIERVRKRLFRIREKRIHPHKDDKILTDWNGLMIAALAKGARAFDEPALADDAKETAHFILKNMKNNGRLLHRFRDGQAALLANLDDYAFLIWGLIELYETTYDVDYLQSALELNHTMVQLFWDKRNGGFYFTPEDGEHLMVRQKQFSDGAIPSGNSIAMWNLLRLGRMTANPDFEQMSLQIVHTLADTIKRLPVSYTKLMTAFNFMTGPSFEVVIAGDSQAKETWRILKTVQREFLPNIVVVFRPSEQESPDIIRIAEYTKHYTCINGQPTAYICTNHKCQSPTTDVDKMLRLLNV